MKTRAADSDDVGGRLAEGDESIKVLILKKWGDWVEASLIRQFGGCLDNADREQCVCKSLDYLWSKRASYSSANGSVKGLLLWKARREALSLIRKRNGRATLSANDPPSTLQSEYTASGDYHVDQEVLDVLQEELLALPSKEREALLGRLSGQDDYARVLAAKRGVVPSTITGEASRAYKKVFARLKQKFNVEE